MKNILKILWSLLVLTGAVMHSSAWSQCTFRYLVPGTGPYFKGEISGMTVPEFSPGDYKILDPIHPEYSAIAKITNTNAPSNTRPFVACPGQVYNYKFGMGTLINAEEKIYSTSMNGIGIKLKINDADVPATAGPGASIPVSMSEKITIQLVKTGDITAPGVLQGSFLRYSVNNSGGQILVDFSFKEPIKVTPRVPTCTVVKQYAKYTMDPVYASVFNGVGSFAPTSTPFDIALKCSGGDRGTATRAFVSFTDANKPANTTTTLSLASPESNKPSATGVGVQILRRDGNEPIRFGPENPAPGAAHQWFAGTIRQGESDFVIPLKARYVKTASTITPGDILAKTIFTISYQ